MFDVVCLGEILIDMIPERGVRGLSYEPNPGGAPANVAVAVSKLGGKSAFIGRVGEDFFGTLLHQTLKTNGVETCSLKTTLRAPTTLAFVHLDSYGERSFSFYRNPGADLFLPWGEEEKQLISSSRIFHFGSLSMTTFYGRRVTKQAIRYAYKRGKIISFDPNLRPSLWKNLVRTRRIILSVMRYVHILKVSEEELFFLSRMSDFGDAVEWAKRLSCPLVLITRGGQGVVCLWRGTTLSTSSYEVKVVDTTGAGDAFVGAFLFCIARQKKDMFSFSSEELLSFLRYASAVAAITVSRRGAIPALPSQEEVERFLAQYT